MSVRFILKVELGNALLQILVQSGRVFVPGDGIMAKLGLSLPLASSVARVEDLWRVSGGVPPPRKPRVRGKDRGVSVVFRRPRLGMRRRTGAGGAPAASSDTVGRAAALARSGLRAAAGFLLVVAGLFALSATAQAQTNPLAVPVSIEAEYDQIGGGLEDLVFTLTRQGTTADELAATVTIAQDEAWLDAQDLTHTVTFEAGKDTASLNFTAAEVSLAPETSGDLTATVSGTGIAGGEVTVEMISVAHPPITVALDRDAYTFAEDATDVAVYVLATLHPAYPRAPSRPFPITISSLSDTADSLEDYAAVSYRMEFNRSEFGRDFYVDGLVARKPVPDFAIVNDSIYEGPERFGMVIEFDPALRAGLVHFAYPDDAACVPPRCSRIPRYPVTITDEEDLPALSLSAAPPSIAEEDDSGTTGVDENVSTLTVSIVNGETLPADRTITLIFDGTAVEGAHYSVSPVDGDAVEEDHQVLLPAGDSSVEVTVIAAANDTADGNRSVVVIGTLGVKGIGSTIITILDDETTVTNTPATGKPTIAGTPYPGRVLTAGVSAIVDADGPPASFTYQWVRVGASDNETVVGANRTYTPTFSDLGSTIKVKVRFIDAAGNPEGPLASEATAVVMPFCEANAVWCTTLIVGASSGDAQGYCGPGTGNNKCGYGGLVDDGFTLDNTVYTVESVRWSLFNLHLTLDKDFPSARLESLALRVGTDGVALSDARRGPTSVANNYRWNFARGELYAFPAGAAITVQLLARAANTPATGMPAIEGVPVADSVLTADVSAIMDADGLLPGFDYQWVRVDALGNETNVGANSSSYTPGFSDVGSTIRVEVSFTDGAAYPVGPLSSEAVGPVLAPVEVTIESEHDSIGGGLEDLVFTLMRDGSTADALEATVTIAQEQAWLGASDLTHTVTFVAGDDTTTLTIEADRFSFDPVTSGDLTATVSETGILRGSDSVEVVSTPDPPITIGYDKPEYTFAEDATDAAVHAVATLHPAYPRAPSFTFDLTFSARSDTAVSPEDYAAVSWQQTFANADFELDDDGLVARKPVSGFTIENDDIYEGSERFDMIIEAAPGLRDGLVQFADPEGATCLPGGCSPVPAYPVTITDEEDQPVLSLSAAPPSIAEEDDGGTMDIAENVSTLTVQITNGKTFAEDRTVTLAFSGSAVEDTHYEVSPDDADPNTADHQVVLPGETASVQATVTAVANATGRGNQSVVVDADLGGTDIGSRIITIVDDETNATGTPTITGVPHVGEALTAGIGNIADADGLPGAFPDDYTFQWVRVDSLGNETHVGANSSNYTPELSDVGSTIRVEVSFTDGAAYPEGPLPSEAVGPVAPVEVTVESKYDSIGGGLEPLVFTLMRDGSMEDALDATVTIDQEQAWLGASDRSHTVTFAAGNDTATLTIDWDTFSLDPVTSGNLTARVSGTGILGGSDSVEVVSTSDPPITIGYDKPEYTFAENTADAAIHAVATLHPAYPRAPSFVFELTFSARSDTAVSPEDYAAVSWQQTFANADFELDDDGLVARKPVSGFTIENDDIYEGSERFDMIIEAGPDLRDGLVQFADPDGGTCVPGGCSPVPAYPVTITDEEDQPVLSLSVAPPSIAEEDDGGTTDIAENVSTLTVQITNGKTFAEDQAVTLAFSGSAVEGTHYEVSPDDADPAAAGHQLVLPGETASVQVTVTAVANATGRGNQSVAVDADLGGTDIGSRIITIVDDDSPTNATGTPTITGVPHVGKVLTADLSNIMDADGLPDAFPDDYTFQWVRVDSRGNETNVGANSSSYTPGFSDAGSTIRVGVSFTDGAGNPEGPLSSEAVPVPVPVTIESKHDSIGGGLESLVFTLTREGSNAGALFAAVAIAQDEAWLGVSDLTHTVTFVAGDDTTTLTIEADRFSFDPVTRGNLTATVSGTGILGGSDSVEIVSTPDPPITIGYDKPEYTFAEDATDAALHAVATLHPAYPRAPVFRFNLTFSARSDTAVSPEDYAAVSWQQTFANADFELDDDRLVARKPVSGFAIENDDIYEGSERFDMIIEAAPGLRDGLVQFADPEGATCLPGGCSPVPAYPVTITDEEDQPVLSLSAAPPSIAEEDDGGTMDIAENVSTLTVQITNGKTFAEDRTVTLAFSGSAVEDSHYSVSPDDVEPAAAGHQLVLPGETASVQATVTAVANASGDGDRSVAVDGYLGGTDIGSRIITIVDDEQRPPTPPPRARRRSRVCRTWARC